LAAVVLAGVLGCGTGACSMSMQLGEFFSDKKEETAVAAKDSAKEVTGSVSASAAARKASADEKMNNADWSLATAALREALAKGDDGSSIPWQNPDTGARGTVTPVASSFVQEGFACRNFLASHVGNGQENWFEGTACRVHRGQWDVRKSRPLMRRS
jgi:surface antigen